MHLCVLRLQLWFIGISRPIPINGLVRKAWDTQAYEDVAR
ncbi:hypothetical protein R69658_07241 [Paraburkholderia aspalathi]|uniref:Uncharacterized protein n=1 Tax=Paraburkholderia aspalathi TaxID=1324617 RepID=A0ABN7N8G1_9BURK|nr:hypothetical protein R69658_07241 [Paraburkholderia aspalathi]